MKTKHLFRRSGTISRTKSYDVVDQEKFAWLEMIRRPLSFAVVVLFEGGPVHQTHDWLWTIEVDAYLGGWF